MVWLVVVVVVLWLVSAGVVFALGVLHASHGMADVEQAKAHLSASDVVDRSATAPLQAAVKEFDSADGLLHSPLLAPLDIVPVIGSQLRSVQDLSAASGQVARIGVGCHRPGPLGAAGLAEQRPGPGGGTAQAGQAGHGHGPGPGADRHRALRGPSSPRSPPSTTRS